MNDLTISRSSLEASRLLSQNQIAVTNSVDANDLSFRKIQAAAEPILSILRNRGLIQEINWVCQEHIGKTINTSQVDESGNITTIFFGSVHASSLGNIVNDVIMKVKALELRKDLLGTLSQNFSSSHLVISDEAINFAVANSLVQYTSVTAPGSENFSFLVVGMLIKLKTPLLNLGGNVSDYPLGFWLTNPANELKMGSTDTSRRGTLNFWDASGAPNGVPAFLKPKKIGHRTGYIADMGSRNVDSVLVTPGYLKGTIIPKNFYAFLQHSRFLISGSQYQPSSGIENLIGLDQVIQDIAIGVRQGYITLGSDPSEFVVGSFNFAESPEAVVATRPYTVAATFGFDAIEPGTLALNYLTTVRRIIGQASNVIALYYPLKYAEADDVKVMAYDLIRLTIKELTFSLPAIVQNTSEGDTLSLLPQHRSLSQYASGFKYPEPIVNVV